MVVKRCSNRKPLFDFPEQPSLVRTNMQLPVLRSVPVVDNVY